MNGNQVRKKKMLLKYFNMGLACEILPCSLLQLSAVQDLKVSGLYFYVHCSFLNGKPELVCRERSY